MVYYFFKIIGWVIFVLNLLILLLSLMGGMSLSYAAEVFLIHLVIFILAVSFIGFAEVIYWQMRQNFLLTEQNKKLNAIIEHNITSRNE